MIDVHSHILAGVDDGPSHTEESLKIIEKGIKEGINTLVLTPHLRESSDWSRIEEIEAAFSLLKKECIKRALDVKLVLGAEVLLIPDLPDRLNGNQIITINGKGKYFLVELPFSQLPFYTEDVLFRLVMNGYTPILAHPERQTNFQRDYGILKKWVENGIKLQLNAGSLTGQYGRIARKVAVKLLKDDLIHLFGSDVHKYTEKGTLLSGARRIASKYVSTEKIEEITKIFPQKVINGE